MKHFNWLNIRLLLMFGVVIFLFSFTKKRNENRKINKIVVKIIDNDTPFLRTEMVNKLLIENTGDVKTLRKENLVLNQLERAINKHDLIKNADVFVSVDGILKAEVKQKTPIGRVVEGNESFYVDYEGEKMPLSENFTARVPLISGEIDAVNKEKLSQVLRMIYKDDFLKKNIIGLEVLPNGSISMQNRNYDFKIDFGRTINMEKKFNNYKAFFQKAVLDSTLNKYKKINLKFTQQVVCIK